MDGFLTIVTGAVASVVEPLLDRPHARHASDLPALVSVLSDDHANALALPMDTRQLQQQALAQAQQQQQRQQLLQERQARREQRFPQLRQQQSQPLLDEHPQGELQVEVTATATASQRRPRWRSVGNNYQWPSSELDSADMDVYGFNDYNDDDENGHDSGPGRSCVDLLLRLLGGCGATEKRINSLPVVALHVDAQGDVADDSVLFNQDTCSICLDGYDVCNTVRVLGCHHVYHAMCIDVWLRRRPTCPMCNLTCC